ncbi:PIG-L family deacetylase [Frigoribacterium salinisoli]
MTFSTPSAAPGPRPAERVLFVHAHPDDETITTGGTIATLVAAGASVAVVTCTRGELGEVLPDDLAALRGDPEALGVHRESEIEAAMRDLGVRDHRFLGAPEARTAGLPARRYRDSGMVWEAEGVAGPTPDLHPDALCAAESGELVSDLAAVVESLRPTAIVSYDEDGGYHHPDHVRVHRVALRVARLTGVPFFAVLAGAAEAEGAEAEALAVDPDVVRVDVRPVASRLLAALRDHRSQVEVVDLPEGRPGLRWPHGAVTPVAASETFRHLAEPGGARGRTSVDWAGEPTGSKATALVLAGVAGALFAAIGTVGHRITTTVAGQPLWTGLVLSLAAVVLLGVGFRLVFGSRRVVAAAGVGALAVIVLFSFPSAGGSVLVPADDRGLLWTFGAAVALGLVLAWPRLEGRGATMDSLPGSKGTPQP